MNVLRTGATLILLLFNVIEKSSGSIIFSFLKTIFFFSVGSLLATYGWYIVFSCILLYVVFQKLFTRLRALRQRQLDRAAAALG